MNGPVAIDSSNLLLYLPAHRADGRHPEAVAASSLVSMNLRRPRQADRRGTTVVETALVLPVFLFLIFALIEFGHAQMVNNVLRSACREGARLGSTQGQSSADVESRVRQLLGGAMDPEQVQVFVKDGSSFDEGASVPAEQSGFESMPDVNLGEAEPRQLFFVRAKVNYNDIALVPMPFMEGVVLQGQAFMRHE